MVKRNAEIEMVRKHWLAHLPQDDKEAEERWEILRMTEDPIAILQKIGIILPPIQYKHNADNLPDALSVDQYVMRSAPPSYGRSSTP